MTDLAVIRKALERVARDYSMREPGRVKDALTALARLEAQQAEGWQLVPVEPTEAMLEELHTRIRIQCDTEEQTATILNDVETYRAMLAVAPPPPAKGEGELPKE